MKVRAPHLLRSAFFGLRLLLIPAATGVAQPFVPVEIGTTVNGFQDDFSGASLGPNWTVAGANVYSVSNGLLHIAIASGDPNHLLYALPASAGSVQEVLVRLRVTSFGSGPYARGGISAAVDPATSQGINLSFRDNDGAGHAYRHTSLLDDFREWGPLQTFAWLTNTWYWLRLRQEPNAASQGGANDVFAKIWPADGTVAEPPGWQLSWNYTPGRSTRTGYAGLMAGSGGGGATDFSAFAVDYFLIKAAGLPNITVAPSAFTQTPATITNQPQNQTVRELAPATFRVGASGNPVPSYQWSRNSTAIPDATNSVFSIARTGLADDGALFQVIVANLVSNVTRTSTSSVVRLTVTADSDPPVLLGARSLGLGLVQAYLSEPIATASAAGRAHYALTGPDGVVDILHAALDGTETNVLLTVSPLTENATYTLVVDGLTDQAVAANILVQAIATFVAKQPAVFITEFVADNTVGLIDLDGAHSDWIELQNQSPFTVDLAGWRLTDDPTNLARWVFPSQVLAAGGFVVVFASGKDRRAPGMELHTNFRLDAEGEYLALVRPDGAVANEFRFGPQHKDASFGLTGGAPRFMVTPTPGVTNGPGVLGFVADTKFEPNRGFFTNAFSLTITSAMAGVEIWFTRDGRVPAPGGPGSTRYSSPVVVANTTTFRATAFLPGYAPSDVDTHTFIFPASTARQPQNPPGFPASWNGYTADYQMDPQIVTNVLPAYEVTNALLALPALCLAAPVDDLFGAVGGIYAFSDQQGDAWEREASVELIFPDGTTGFQYEAGLRVHGYTSRYHSTTLKHSLRVSFRDRYGPAKLHFPLFPDAGVTEFDALVLRACSTDSYAVVDGLPRWEARRATYLRDQWMRDAMRDLGQLTAHGRYVHLWINGLYWGLYNVCESVGSGFAAEHLGGTKDEYDVIKDYFFIDDGNRQAWDEAAALAAQGFANDANFQRLQGNNADGTRNPNFPIHLNVSNYVDYVMLHIMSGANDWPMNNWWSCRRRGPLSEGFRFCVWDQEISNESLTTTANVFCQPFAAASENSCLATPGEYHGAYFYDLLRRTSAGFRQQFMDRAWFAHAGNGPLSPAANAARWLVRQREIDRAIVAETARWGDARREPPYTRQGHWLPEMSWVANYWASNQTRVIQRYRSVGLWPMLGPPAFSRTNGYFTNQLSLSIAHTNPVGTIWFTLDGTDPRAPGGARSAGAHGYSTPLMLTNATRIRARVSDGTNWSPPADLTMLPLQALTNLIVAEIYYNPPGSPGVDGETFEFLELQNIGSFVLDLSGLRFSGGIDFTFTNGTTLAAGDYWVLARAATNFGLRFPGVAFHGLYAGKLDNDGESISLQNAINDDIFTFAFNDRFPWPGSADGAGDSLHRISFGDPTNAAHWCAAVPTPGRPAPPACRDEDRDGLSEEWELAHGLNPEDSTGENGAAGDPDHDGVPNIAEFMAGTDPRDAASYLKIESLSATPGISLTFVASSNKTYSVQFTDALDRSAWTNLTNVDAETSSRMAVIHDTNSPPRRIYRLATPRQP